MSACRYGVFDEHGYPGDPLYPLFYYETVEDGDGGGDDFRYVLRTSFCTNQELDGHRMYVCAKKKSFRIIVSNYFISPAEHCFPHR